jgi:hypothetical protein
LFLVWFVSGFERGVFGRAFGRFFFCVRASSPSFPTPTPPNKTKQTNQTNQKETKKQTPNSNKHTSTQLWLGGSSNQTRLAETYLERLKLADLESTLEPLFYYWGAARRAGEGFGDFCARVGFASLREYSAGYVPQAASANGNGSGNGGGANGSAVALPAEQYAALAAAAAAQGKSVAHLASEALKKQL